MPKATNPKSTTIPDTPEKAQEQTSRSTLDVRIHSIRPEGNIRATASVNINGDFAIRNVKVMDGSKGLFISMPSYKNANGEYKDICFPITKESREQLNNAVFAAYEQALSQNQGQSQKQEPPEPEQAPGMTMSM